MSEMSELEVRVEDIDDWKWWTAVIVDGYI
jgi:hypothetical protein